MSDDYRDDLIYQHALTIQSDPGLGTVQERMMRRLAAATAQRAMEESAERGLPVTLRQRKILAEMLEIDFTAVGGVR